MSKLWRRLVFALRRGRFERDLDEEMRFHLEMKTQSGGGTEEARYAAQRSGQTVDFYLSETRDREAAKCFLRRALANPDNRAPYVFARDRLRSYPAAIRELQNEGHLHRNCRHRTRRYANNRIESDHRHVKRRLRAMQGPRTTATACALIAGIEAVQMIRKGQVLGITKKNLHGQAWIFGNLYGSLAPD